MPTVLVRTFRDIGLVIKAIRESLAIRQEDLAEQRAFSRDYLIDLEKGKGNL
jgi:cytoskeletal protein RodZ